WRGFRRPGIGLVIGCYDRIGASAQKLAECGDIQPVISRSEPREVPLGESEQTDRGRQTPAMFRMQRILEAFLKMNESAGRLNQSFEIVRIGRFGLEPKLLEHIMRLVITFFIPAMEKCPIKWMFHNVSLVRIDIFHRQLGHEPRNPLAFVHQELNLLTAQIMRKPARTSFSKQQDCPPSTAEFSQPAWLC